MNRRKLLKALSLTIAGTALSLPGSARLVDTGDPQPVYIPPGGGKKGTFGENEITFKLNSEQTSSALGSSEGIIHPGFMGAPPHYHKNFDEIIRVLTGQVTVLVGDQVYEVPAGGWHLRPRGITHTFWNSGTTPASYIELYTPGGHEKYMQELTSFFENGKRPTREQMKGLADKYDIVFQYEKLQEIEKKYKVKL